MKIWQQQDKNTYTMLCNNNTVYRLKVVKLWSINTFVGKFNWAVKDEKLGIVDDKNWAPTGATLLHQIPPILKRVIFDLQAKNKKLKP